MSSMLLSGTSFDVRYRYHKLQLKIATFGKHILHIVHIMKQNSLEKLSKTFVYTRLENIYKSLQKYYCIHRSEMTASGKGNINMTHQSVARL